MNSALTIDRERSKRRTFADLLIGIPPNPTFIDFRHDIPQGRPDSPCPIKVMWARLAEDPKMAGQIATLLEQEFKFLQDQATAKDPSRNVDVITAVDYGLRWTGALQQATGLNHVHAIDLGNKLVPQERQGSSTILVEDFTVTASGPRRIREALQTRQGTTVEGAIALLAYGYPANIREFEGAKIPFRFLTSMSDIAESLLMDRFRVSRYRERLVDDFLHWDHMQRRHKA